MCRDFDIDIKDILYKIIIKEKEASGCQRQKEEYKILISPEEKVEEKVEEVEEKIEEVILDLDIKILKNKKKIKDLQHKNKILQIRRKNKIYLKKEKDKKNIIDELLDTI